MWVARADHVAACGGHMAARDDGKSVERIAMHVLGLKAGLRNNEA